MFKRLFRWLFRSVLISLALFLILAVSRYISHRYRPGSVIVLELDGPLQERASGQSFGLRQPRGGALNTIRTALRGAQDDPRIVGMAIKIIDPEMELAQAQELCGLIDDFRAHGKWTTAYMETAGASGFGNLPYLIASAADELSMMPQGEMNLLGVGMREMFARGLLDWIKVKPVFDAIGKYKSAANIFTQKDFTPGQREEDEGLATSISDQIVTTSARHRHLAPDAIRAIIDRAPITAADGLKAKLLDRLEYEDQFGDRVRAYRGEHHNLIDADAYVGPHESYFGERNKIAVIYGIGAIQRGAGGYDPVLSPGANAMGSDDMIKAFDAARDDDAVRAVVFRINSPGGEVIASELIRRAVELCAGRKPVVVSMGGYAASGGFWIATPAARLFADPGTLTGSIGVLGGKFNIAGGATALGINSGIVQRGANADMYDSFTDFTPAQAQIFHEQILGDTYNYFVKLVAAQRHMSIAQVDAIAQGRVWTGVQALQVKLIDYLGDFDAALNEAKLLAKLDPHQRVQIVELPEQVNPLIRLLSGQVYGETSWRPPQALAPLLRGVREAMARAGAFGEVYCPLRPLM
ncbi:MAG TPA: signal peptide peptidase SppA [Candidatus Binataceae bacterium]|nr:signal peptide peptidase SppA [Candidatus Binataceae bacterium]